QSSEETSDDLYCDPFLEFSNLFWDPYYITTTPGNVHLAYLWKCLKKKGVSNEAIELSCKSLDFNSISTVSSNLRIWTLWCSKDPIRCPIIDIMQFLTEKDREGKSYNTIALYRSAISEIHKEVEGVPVGRNKDVAKIMLGIFKMNPPKKPGDKIYDITPSLDYIVSLGNNNLLPLIALAKKIAFLCALSLASRPSDLA
ncbi:5647_t:CDS:2, partial [Gigaspora rosea]